MYATAFSFHIRRSYGLNRRGQCANISVANFKGRNISVCAAIIVAGLINYRSTVALNNQTEFVQFLGQFWQRLSPSSKIFVMDNVVFHHSIGVHKVLESRGHRIFFLPPYSQQLEHIEWLLSKRNSIIKSEMSIFYRNNLLATISETSAQISQNHDAKWILELQREPFN